MSERVTVGVIGCGAISAAYFKMAANFPFLDVVACADLDQEKAQAKAAEFGIPRVLTPEALLADDQIEVVLNLTVPKAHAPLTLQALEAGKHSYGEKPFGINRAEGESLLAAAKAKGKLLGCAPDTVLGAGLQTARKVIDDGRIGRPVSFTGFVMGGGHESWHPNPDFFYKPGGGPMFDMGPYYLTALLNLLGPVKRLSGIASIAIPERIITSEPRKGTPISVETPDHICGVLEFECGAVGTLVTSFASLYGQYNGQSPITIYGTEGTLLVPDPNGFDGPVKVRGKQDADFVEVPHAFVTGYGRAVGLADMARAIRTGRAYRCNGEQAFYVLDLMQGFLDASASGADYVPHGTYQRPAPMPAKLPFGELD